MEGFKEEWAPMMENLDIAEQVGRWAGGRWAGGQASGSWRRAHSSHVGVAEHVEGGVGERLFVGCG